MILKLLRSVSAKTASEAGGNGGHERADVHQVSERDNRGQQAAGEIDQAGADEVAHAFDVAHDARNQRARPCSES